MRPPVVACRAGAGGAKIEKPGGPLSTPGAAIRGMTRRRPSASTGISGIGAFADTGQALKAKPEPAGCRSRRSTAASGVSRCHFAGDSARAGRRDGMLRERWLGTAETGDRPAVLALVRAQAASGSVRCPAFGIRASARVSGQPETRAQLVEAGGIEPPSASPRLQALRT